MNSAPVRPRGARRRGGNTLSAVQVIGLCAQLLPGSGQQPIQGSGVDFLRLASESSKVLFCVRGLVLCLRQSEPLFSLPRDKQASGCPQREERGQITVLRRARQEIGIPQIKYRTEAEPACVNDRLVDSPATLRACRCYPGPGAVKPN